MKKTFHAYYRPSEEEFQSLWDNCIFVLDANVLLNIYRYSPDTRKKFLEILKNENISSRLWIPHQAAKEYHENRLNVIKQQEKAYDELIESLNRYSENLQDLLNKIKNDLNSHKKHPFIDVEIFSKKLDKFKQINELTEIYEELEKNKKNHPVYTFESDDLMDELTDLLNGKVGSKCSAKDLEKIYKIGQTRYKRELPPGYADTKKDKKDKTKLKKYSDLILWFQIIEKTKNSRKKKPIIFVTDDEKKGDWFWTPLNNSVGPRPELIEEMKDKTKVPFYLYSANRFMEYSRKYLDIEVDQDAIDEVETLQNYNLSGLKSWRSINEPVKFVELMQPSRSIATDFKSSFTFKSKSELFYKLLDIDDELKRMIKLNNILPNDLKLTNDLRELELELDKIEFNIYELKKEFQNRYKNISEHLKMLHDEMTYKENEVIKLEDEDHFLAEDLLKDLDKIRYHIKDLEMENHDNEDNIEDLELYLNKINDFRDKIRTLKY